jgi:hypothetical protein
VIEEEHQEKVYIYIHYSAIYSPPLWSESGKVDGGNEEDFGVTEKNQKHLQSIIGIIGSCSGPNLISIVSLFCIMKSSSRLSR